MPGQALVGYFLVPSTFGLAVIALLGAALFTLKQRAVATRQQIHTGKMRKCGRILPGQRARSAL